MSVNLLKKMLEKEGITKYELSQCSGVPYSTIQDICKEKRIPSKCTAETIYKIAKVLRVPMEDLVKPYVEDDFDEDFRGKVIHRLERDGKTETWIWLLRSGCIRRYWYDGEYFKSLYLLGLLDFLSRGMPNRDVIEGEYCYYRKNGFKDLVLSSGKRLKDADPKVQEQINKDMEKAIPEFYRLGIVETDLPTDLEY